MSIQTIDLKELINRLHSDPIKSLGLISDYLTAATGFGCGIIVDDPEHSPQPGTQDKPVFIGGVCVMSIGRLSADVKAVSFPITESIDELKDDRRTYSGKIKNLKGYICRLDGAPIHEYRDICRDVSGLSVNLIEMYQTERIASRDKLTGALNRKYLDIHLERRFENAVTKRRKFSILMADMDNFKYVNDTYGHVKGDEIMKIISGIMHSCIGKDSVLGRYGGDEFIVILKDKDSKAASEVAARICAEVCRVKDRGETLGVTLSIGIATYPDHAITKTSLLDCADSALYTAKRSISDPGSRYSVWDDYMNVLTEGLSGNEFFSGDSVRDILRFNALFNILGLVRLPIDKKSKLYTALKIIIEVLDATSANVFTLKDDSIQDEYFVIRPGGFAVVHNTAIIAEVISKKTDVCMVDWEAHNLNVHTGITDWQSVICSPVIINGTLKGVLYVTASLKEKEFNIDEKNFLHNLALTMATFM